VPPYSLLVDIDCTGNIRSHQVNLAKNNKGLLMLGLLKSRPQHLLSLIELLEVKMADPEVVRDLPITSINGTVLRLFVSLYCQLMSSQ